MNASVTREDIRQARLLYEDYKAGLPVPHSFSCGHIRMLRAFFDRKLKPVKFETFTSELFADAERLCYDCQKAQALENVGDYVYIRKWGYMLGSTHWYIDEQVELARRDGAPQNATYRNVDGTWHTTDAITNNLTRVNLGLEPRVEVEP